MHTAGASAASEVSSRNSVTKRLLSALVALPIITAAAWAGDPWYTPLVFAALLIASLEFFRMAPGGKSGTLLAVAAFVVIILFLVNAYLGGGYTALVLTLAVLISFSGPLFIKSSMGEYGAWLWTLAGILYVGWLGSHFISIRALENGREWTLLVMYATFATDTAAFLIGRWLGRHRLVPSISPGKTWEGAVGGFAGGTLAAPALSALLGLPVPFGYSLLAGVIIGTVGQVGDLAESMVKRTAGVKDAGSIIPGHGGILDRLDSLVFVTPLIYYYAKWLMGA